MKLTASIVAFHTSPDELTSALDALGREGVLRTFVVDNSQSDYIARICAQHSSVNYIPSENIGYGAGHNKALRKALELGVDYHLVMNSDVTIPPGTLKTLAAIMDSDPDVGMIQPRIVNPEGQLQFTARMLPTPFDLIGRRFIPGFSRLRRNYHYELQYLDHSKPFEAPYFQGSFMFLRMDAIKAVGMFDERFFLYPEDIDLSRRIAAKFKALYTPQCTITHWHRRSSYHSFRIMVTHCLNMVKYFNKWGWLCDSERRRINRKLLKNAR